MHRIVAATLLLLACGEEPPAAPDPVPPAVEAPGPAAVAPGAPTLSDAASDGRTRVQAQDFDGALATLDLAVAADPSDVGALLWRGKAWEGKGDKAHAEQDYLAAIALDAGHAEARQALADLLVAQRRCPDAMPHLDVRVAQDPDSAAVWSNRAFCRNQLKDLEGAHDDLQQACSRGDARACRAVPMLEGRMSTAKATEAAKAVGLQADDVGGF